MLNRKRGIATGQNPADWPLIVILTVMIANIHFVVKLTDG